MGGLGSKLAKAFKKCPVRIAMLGLDGAGKTTILYKFKLNETVPSIPTIGFNVETLTPVKGLTFTVWDMGGQERMRALWRMYLRGTDGIFFVVDSADYERVLEAREELWRVLETPEVRGIPLMIIANKQDLSAALDTERLAKQLQLPRLQGRPWAIQGTCATTGAGIADAMEGLSKLVHDYRGKKS